MFGRNAGWAHKAAGWRKPLRGGDHCWVKPVADGEANEGGRCVGDGKHKGGEDVRWWEVATLGDWVGRGDSGNWKAY